jgi:hypothetical protein
MTHPKPSAALQIALGLGFLGLVGGLAVWHRGAADRHDSASFTVSKVDEVKAAYLAEPFGLEQHIANYERVRDIPDRAPEARRIYELGAQRLIAYQGRLVQIQSAVRANRSPSEFLRTNITNQEANLAAFLTKNPVMPPGSAVSKQFAEMALELELWHRCSVMLDAQTPAQPYPANPQSLLP